MRIEPSVGGSRLWDRLVDSGFFWASEIVARLPERLVLSMAESRLRTGIPWPQGVEFLLHVLRVLHRSWPTLHPNVRRRFIENLFGHGMLRGAEKRRRACERLGDYPTVMVISPTMRCNLHCRGCYSYHYDRRDAITTARFDQLLDECRELGIMFVVVTGGEPFLRDDLLGLIAAHPDLYFMTYTNATLIADRGLAPRLAELGNVMPCVSVEGFEQETEERRGRGTYSRIRRAMREMREAGLLFGFSATPMRHNSDLLLSDRFIEHYLAQGCRVGWYFSYMPVGRNPELAAMPTPAQRLHRYHRIRDIRQHYPIVAADFWCDGILTGGCLSGGRTYFHVNAAGGVEPCVFHQFSTDNILEKPLLDCLDSAYFRDVRCGLRQVENPLRPCPVIDNPWMLREWVAAHRPRPSQPGCESILTGELAAGLDRYSAELKTLFDPVFQRDGLGTPWPLEPSGTWEQKEAARRLDNGA